MHFAHWEDRYVKLWHPLFKTFTHKEFYCKLITRNSFQNCGINVFSTLTKITWSKCCSKTSFNSKNQYTPENLYLSKKLSHPSVLLMSGEKCIVEKLVALYVSWKFYGLKKIPWSIIISCNARKLLSTFDITRLHFYILVHITFLVSYRKFCIYFHEISLLYS